jgi:hypothetical protein
MIMILDSCEGKMAYGSKKEEPRSASASTHLLGIFYVPDKELTRKI